MHTLCITELFKIFNINYELNMASERRQQFQLFTEMIMVAITWPLRRMYQVTGHKPKVH